MKVAFYRGAGKPFDKLTKWWTRGQFSHCELVFTDSGLSASSSFRDGGVRFKTIDYEEHVDRWEFVELDFLGPDATTLAWNYFDLHKEEGYDVLGLLGFAFRFYKGDRNKKFCSEAVAESIGFTNPWRYDPNTLYEVLVKLKEVGKNASI